MLRSSTSLEIDLVVDAKIAIEEFHCFSTTRAVDVTDEFQTQTRHGQEVVTTSKPALQAPEPLKSFARPVEGDKFGRKPKARRKR